MKKLFVGIICSLLPIATLAAMPKTLSNLNKALRGETNASHRYEIFAQKADKEGYTQIAKLFRAVSMAESVHRNNHKAAILNSGGKVDVIEYDKVPVGTTKQNLTSQIKGENYETKTMYPEFLKQATVDKLNEAVKSFSYAGNAEPQHEKLFKDALNNFGKNKREDYCVSRMTGDTIAIQSSAKCPLESYQTERYIRISK